MEWRAFLLFGLAFVHGGDCYKRMKLHQELPYTFQNVADHGFLTASTNFNPVRHEQDSTVFTDTFRGVASQLWRVSKGYIYTVYMMKPISDGKDTKISLAVGRDELGHPIAKREKYIVGMDNSLYWSILPGRDGYYMIQNYAGNLCLESRGAGAPVGVGPCSYAPNQMWAIRGQQGYIAQFPTFFKT